jgi:C1q domain
MSTVKTNNVQLGNSATATQNFTLTAAASNGTMKIARGNQGSTTQDVLTVSSVGVVNAPVNNVVLISRRPTSFTTTANTAVVVPFTSIDIDNKNSYNTTTGRFQPTVAGVYQISFGAVVAGGTTSTRIFMYARKNGTTAICRTSDCELTVGSAACSGSGLINLNGSTDYLEILIWANATGTNIGANETHFSAVLVQPL